jgi:hypothetical protein
MQDEWRPLADVESGTGEPASSAALQLLSWWRRAKMSLDFDKGDDRETFCCA